MDWKKLWTLGSEFGSHISLWRVYPNKWHLGIYPWVSQYYMGLSVTLWTGSLWTYIHVGHALRPYKVPPKK